MTSAPTSRRATIPGTSGCAWCRTPTCSRRSSNGSASIVTGEIESFTETGLRLKTGEALEADIVVTATGLKLQLLSDVAFSVDGERRDLSKTLSYRGMMFSDVPNLSYSFGYTNASWTLKADLTGGYLHPAAQPSRQDRDRDRPPRPRAGIEEVPFLDFTSGYVQRARDILPKQGSKKPWKLYQNYALDMMSLKFASVEDGVIRFLPRGAPASRQPARENGSGMRVEGRTAVITGAASGIGRGTALALAKRGCNLALADLDEDGPRRDRGAGREHGVKISRHRLDVASREAVAALPEAVLAAHGRADLLFNNAGVAIGGTFEQVAEEDFDWLMEINFWGVVRMTRAFLPLLRSSDSARIINISSIFGIIAPPGQTAYSASKFAVRAFSESLRRELEAEGSKIGVTVVHPGGVDDLDRQERPAAAGRERHRPRGAEGEVREVPSNAAGQGRRDHRHRGREGPPASHRRQRRALHGGGRAAGAGILLEDPGEGPEMIPFLLAGAGGLGLLGGGLAAYQRRHRPQDRESGAARRRADRGQWADAPFTSTDGSGPPIVMIHGLGGQMRNFARAMVDDLARDYRVIRIDRPGSGYSPRAASHFGAPARPGRDDRRADPDPEARPAAHRRPFAGRRAGALDRAQPSRRGRRARPRRAAHPGPGHRRRAGGLQGAGHPLAGDAQDDRLDDRHADGDGEGRGIAEGGVRARAGAGGFRNRGRRPAGDAAEQFLRLLGRPVDLEGELEGMVERYPTLSVPVSILYAARRQSARLPSSTASGRRARFRAPRSSWSRAATCSPSPSRS